MSFGTPLLVNQNPGGLFSILSLLETPGSTFYVNSATGSDAAGYGYTPNAPVDTLDYAIGLATASKGDVIVVMPGHAETTTAIALDKAGVRIVGLGFGANRPTFTSTAAATDLLNITAANCIVENVRFVGAASDCTALVDLSAAATDCQFKNCEFLQAATPLSCITIAGAERFIFSDCAFRGTANGPDRVFDIEVGCDNWVIERCRFHYPLGLDNEWLKSVAVCLGYIINDVTVVGIDTLLVNISSSSATPPDGLFATGRVMVSAPVTSLEIIVASATSKGMAFGTVIGVDDVQKAGTRIPLVTAS